MPRRKVSLFYSPAVQAHTHPWPHIEKCTRASNAYEHLKQRGLIGRCVEHVGRAARDDELLTVHSQRHIDEISQMSAAAALRTVSETPISLPRQRLDRLELVPSVASVAGQVESGAGPTGEGPSAEALPAESIVGELLEGVVNEAARLGEARADLHVELSNLRALIDAERRAKARILSSAIVCPHCEEIC